MSAWLAANSGNKEALAIELDKGADIEYKDPMGRTALMEAARYGHTDCVRELLDRGADPTSRSAMGWTAADYHSGHGEIKQLLDEATKNWLANKGHSQDSSESNKENHLLSENSQLLQDAQQQQRSQLDASPRGGNSTPSPRAPQLSSSPHSSVSTSLGRNIPISSSLSHNMAGVSASEILSSSGGHMLGASGGTSSALLASSLGNGNSTGLDSFMALTGNQVPTSIAAAFRQPSHASSSGSSLRDAPQGSGQHHWQLGASHADFPGSQGFGGSYSGSAGALSNHMNRASAGPARAYSGPAPLGSTGPLSGSAGFEGPSLQHQRSLPAGADVQLQQHFQQQLGGPMSSGQQQLHQQHLQQQAQLLWAQQHQFGTTSAAPQLQQHQQQFGAGPMGSGQQQARPSAGMLPHQQQQQHFGGQMGSGQQQHQQHMGGPGGSGLQQQQFGAGPMGGGQQLAQARLLQALAASQPPPTHPQQQQFGGPMGGGQQQAFGGPMGGGQRLDVTLQQQQLQAAARQHLQLQQQAAAAAAMGAAGAAQAAGEGGPGAKTAAGKGGAGQNAGRPVCRYWHSGRCLYGVHCRFAHPTPPPISGTGPILPVCRYWRSGMCRYGPACRFRHPPEEQTVQMRAQMRAHAAGDGRPPLSSDYVSSGGPSQRPGGLAEHIQQQQQQRGRNYGFTDSEMMDLLARGIKPWDIAMGTGTGSPTANTSTPSSVLAAFQSLGLGSSQHMGTNQQNDAH